jgi:hypothetical protein
VATTDPLDGLWQTGHQSLRTEKGGGQGWGAGNRATVQFAAIGHRSSVRTEFGAEVTRRVNVGKKDGSVSEPHGRGPRLSVQPQPVASGYRPLSYDGYLCT